MANKGYSLPDTILGFQVIQKEGLEIGSEEDIAFRSLNDYVLLTIKSKDGQSITLTFAELESLYNQARKMLKLD